MSAQSPKPDDDDEVARAAAARLRVQVEPTPFYLADQSDPAHDRYLFGYHIRIINQGTETVQLLSRHWRITDSDGRVEEVRGPGVVGEQPVLPPGAQHEYQSGARLRGPVGTMEGSYQFVTAGGEAFEVPIPRFTLSTARVLH